MNDIEKVSLGGIKYAIKFGKVVITVLWALGILGDICIYIWDLNTIPFNVFFLGLVVDYSLLVFASHVLSSSISVDGLPVEPLTLERVIEVSESWLNAAVVLFFINLGVFVVWSLINVFR